MKAISETFNVIGKWLDTHKKQMLIVLLIELIILALIYYAQYHFKHGIKI